MRSFYGFGGFLPYGPLPRAKGKRGHHVRCCFYTIFKKSDFCHLVISQCPWGQKEHAARPGFNKNIIQVKADTACINMFPTVQSMRSCHTCLGGKLSVRSVSLVISDIQGKWKRKYVGQSLTGEEAAENRVDQKNHEGTIFLQSSGILQASRPLKRISICSL